MVNALTIDVEDYFHVTAFENSVSRSAWDTYPSRVYDNTRRILDLLDEYEVKATFFILGWVAERWPRLVRDIARLGHEVASHGYEHQLVFRIGRTSFREDVRKSKAMLQDITGQRVAGYRAPSYSITADSLWALDILIEEGFLYDSSIFPIHHDTYGIPQAERFPHAINREHGSIREFPLTTFRISFAGLNANLPVAGGGYLRLLPAFAVAHAIRHVNGNDRRPAVLYFHPWEIDPDQPRIAAPLKSRVRHYLNLHRTEHKLRYLLDRFAFAPMGEVVFQEPDFVRAPQGVMA